MAERRRTRFSSKITQLPEELKERLDEKLLDTANTYEDIAEWLKTEGYDISKSAVGRYAIRANQATQRVVETLEKTKAIAAAVESSHAHSAGCRKSTGIRPLSGVLEIK